MGKLVRKRFGPEMDARAFLKGRISRRDLESSAPVIGSEEKRWALAGPHPIPSWNPQNQLD